MPSTSLLIRTVATACFVLPAGVALAQGAIKPIEARIVNTPSNPVPVVGTVTLGGNGVTGTLKSGDKTVTVHEAPIQVTTSVSGNHMTAQFDVSDYKEGRVAVSSNSCSPCADIVVAVIAVTANGGVYQIDEFPVNVASAGPDGGRWNSKTYSTPGSKIFLTLRTTASGASHSLRVALLGRAN
jgi:hypothetical protein